MVTNGKGQEDDAEAEELPGSTVSAVASSISTSLQDISTASNASASSSTAADADEAVNNTKDSSEEADVLKKPPIAARKPQTKPEMVYQRLESLSITELESKLTEALLLGDGDGDGDGDAPFINSSPGSGGATATAAGGDGMLAVPGSKSRLNKSRGASRGKSAGGGGGGRGAEMAGAEGEDDDDELTIPLPNTDPLNFRYLQGPFFNWMLQMYGLDKLVLQIKAEDLAEPDNDASGSTSSSTATTTTLVLSQELSVAKIRLFDKSTRAVFQNDLEKKQRQAGEQRKASMVAVTLETATDTVYDEATKTFISEQIRVLRPSVWQDVRRVLKIISDDDDDKAKEGATRGDGRSGDGEGGQGKAGGSDVEGSEAESQAAREQREQLRLEAEQLENMKKHAMALDIRSRIAAVKASGEVIQMILSKDIEQGNLLLDDLIDSMKDTSEAKFVFEESIHNLRVCMSLLYSEKQINGKMFSIGTILSQILATRDKCKFLRQKIMDWITELSFLRLNVGDISIADESELSLVNSFKEAAGEAATIATTDEDIVKLFDDGSSNKPKVVDPAAATTTTTTSSTTSATSTNSDAATSRKEAMLKRTLFLQRKIDLCSNRLSSLCMLELQQLLHLTSLMNKHVKTTDASHLLQWLQFLDQMFADENRGIREIVRSAIVSVARARFNTYAHASIPVATPADNQLIIFIENMINKLHETLKDPRKSRMLRRKKQDFAFLLSNLVYYCKDSAIRADIVALILLLMDDLDSAVRDTVLRMTKVLVQSNIPEMQVYVQGVGGKQSKLMSIVNDKLKDADYPDKAKMQDLFTFLIKHESN
jgi:hypothetical protein